MILGLGFESWLLVRSNQQVSLALGGLEQKRQARETFQQQVAGPSEETGREILQELGSVRARLAAARATLAGDDETIFNAPPPAKSIDAFFDVADFIEKTRTLAAQAQVAIRSDEHFGFSTHATEGPATELTAAVYRQRVIVQFLIGALFEARPTALFLVQRERPLSAVQRTERNQPRVTSFAGPGVIPVHDDPADFFELAPRYSLRRSGELDTDAFKLEFSGQTRTLRGFMNHLAFCELPLVVRSVEVEPINSTAAAVSVASQPLATATPIPIVAQSISRFRVIVELIRPITQTESQP